MNIKKRLSISGKIASRIFLNDARRPGLYNELPLPGSPDHVCDDCFSGKASVRRIQGRSRMLEKKMFFICSILLLSACDKGSVYLSKNHNCAVSGERCLKILPVMGMYDSCEGTVCQYRRGVVFRDRDEYLLLLKPENLSESLKEKLSPGQQFDWLFGVKGEIIDRVSGKMIWITRPERKPILIVFNNSPVIRVSDIDPARSPDECECVAAKAIAEHDQGTAMSGGYKLPRIFGVNMGRQSPVKKQGCGIYMSCQ